MRNGTEHKLCVMEQSASYVCGGSVPEWFGAVDMKPGGFRGSNPPPYCFLDLFSVVQSSTPRPRCVNSQQPPISWDSE